MTTWPINTKTACRLKWGYSTLFLSRSKTASCHRVEQTEFTADEFDDFHNLPAKIRQREAMLRGEWPGEGCEYCKNIEDSGGFSDRQLHLTDTFDDLTAPELASDPTATSVTPRLLEIYFNNHCNFKCLYCGPWFSSQWASEMKKHSDHDENKVIKTSYDEWQFNPEYAVMLDKLWAWLGRHHLDLRNLHVLGGEPLLQPEFLTMLDFLEEHPSPDLCLNVVTNLSADDARMDMFISRFRRLIAKRKIKMIQITASLDCWGPQIEYIRHGLDLEQWHRNFEKLLDHRWINLQINHAMSVLSIKYMPDLLRLMQQWNQKRPIYNNFMLTLDPPYMTPTIMGGDVFVEDFKLIDSLMLDDNELTANTKRYMQGLAKVIAASQPDPRKITRLENFLKIIDSRRGTNHRALFPWLKDIFDRYREQ